MFGRKRRDEDDVDRLNRVWTVLIFVVTAIGAIVYIAIFPDAAISCVSTGSKFIAPATYANRYCLDESIFRAKDYTMYGGTLFSYHTFIPLLLFYQALGFILPHIFAQFFKRLLGSGSEFLFVYAEASKLGADGFQPKSEADGFQSRTSCLPPSSVMCTAIYLCKKILYFINAMVQLVVIALLFSPDKRFDADQSEYYQGSDAKGLTDAPFPRYAECTFDIPGESTQFFQCTLHINGLFRKFYMFLFYWLLIVAFANLVSLIAWILLLFVPRLTSEKIKMYTMPAADDKTESSAEKSQTFVKDHLGKDYLLNLLLAQSTEREATAADLTLKLWRSYASTSPASTSPTSNGAESHYL